MSRLRQFILVLYVLLYSGVSNAQATATEDQEVLFDSLYYLSWDQLGYDPEASLNTAHHYLNVAELHGDSLNIAFANVQIGLAHYYQSNMDSAIYYGKHALNLASAIHDTDAISTSRTNLGMFYLYSGNFSQAINNFRKSYLLDTAMGYGPAAAMFFHYGLANSYIMQDEVELAENHILQSSAAMREDTFYLDHHAGVYITWAEILLAKSEYDSTLTLLNKAEAQIPQIQDTVALADIWGLRAEIALKRGNIDRAEEMALQSYNLILKHGDPYSHALALDLLARVYKAHQRYDRALDTARSAERIAVDHDLILVKQKVFATLYEIHESQGDWQKALHYNKKEYALSDTLNKVKTQERLKELDNTAAQQKIQLLELQDRVQDERLKRKNAWLVFILVFLLIGLIIIVVQRRSKRRLEKNNALLESRNRAISKQQEELDAKSRALEEGNEKLKKLNDSKDRLLSVLAHDLRQPFHQLTGLIDIIREQDIEEEEKNAMLDQLKESVRSTSDLVNNLLIWSKAQFAGVNQKPDDIELAPFVKKQVLQQSIAFERKSIQVHVDIEEGLYFRFDENHLAVVVRNLLQNAMKFSKANSNIWIEGYCSDSGRGVLEVKDEGVGMSKAKLEQLNAPSIPEDITTTGTLNEKGSGLGMLIIKQFLAENEATLEIESTEAQGSTFRICAPLCEVHHSGEGNKLETTKQ